MSDRDARQVNAARFSSSPPASPPDPPPDPAGEPRTAADRDAAVVPPGVVASRIRGTYDLYPVDFRRFAARCATAAEENGEVRVTKQDGIEAAVRLILHDETVARRWVAELRALARENR